MERDWRSAIALPVSVREGLERCCHQLRDALGEQLVAVILYGGLRRGSIPHSIPT
jgi:hypothetical protein